MGGACVGGRADAIRRAAPPAATGDARPGQGSGRPHAGRQNGGSQVPARLDCATAVTWLVHVQTSVCVGGIRQPKGVGRATRLHNAPNTCATSWLELGRLLRSKSCEE